MSPASRPRVSGCRASRSRPCRCRQAPVHAGPLQLRRKSTGHQDPGPAASRSGPFAYVAEFPRGQGQRSATTQRQQVDVAQLEEHRSPKPAAGGSIPSVHANRGRSHGHRTRDLAERPAEQRGTGLTVTWPWGHLSRLRPQQWGVRANSIVDSIRQEPDPHCGSGFLSPKRPMAETSGMPALRHMRRLGNWLARLAVDQVPSRGMQVRVLPDAPGGTSRWPATAAVSKTEGPHGRASSILAPSAVGRRRRVARRPVATRVVAVAMRFDSSTFRRLCRSSWSGRPPVEREITGSSPVRSAQEVAGAVVAAGCQSGLSIRAARVRSPSTAHHTRPMV
jgi:hypothetical protein